MIFNTKHIKLWLPVVIWCSLIFYFSSIPSLGLEDPLLNLILRKIAHIAEYFILAALFYRALKGTFTNLPLPLLRLLTALLSIAYAASDEYHQSFISNRSGNLRDMGFDAMGVLLLVLLIKIKEKNANH